MNIQQILGENARATHNNEKKVLDKDDFLKLMITQMKHQDPMEPLDNSQMTAQMAQFSSLEQMANLNKHFAAAQETNLFAQATSWIGKQVEADILDVTGNHSSITGEVEFVRMGTDGPILKLKGEDSPLRMEDIIQVGGIVVE